MMRRLALLTGLLLVSPVAGAHAQEEAPVDSLALERGGIEIEVVEETWKLRNGQCQYWRTANFSGMDEPLLVRWVLKKEGEIVAVGLGPASQPPMVESETCGAEAP